MLKANPMAKQVALSSLTENLELEFFQTKPNLLCAANILVFDIFYLTFLNVNYYVLRPYKGQTRKNRLSQTASSSKVLRWHLTGAHPEMELRSREDIQTNKF